MTDTPSPSLGGPLLFLIPVLIGAIFSIFAIRNIIRRTKAPSEPQ